MNTLVFEVGLAVALIALAGLFSNKGDLRRKDYPMEASWR